MSRRAIVVLLTCLAACGDDAVTTDQTLDTVQDTVSDTALDTAADAVLDTTLVDTSPDTTAPACVPGATECDQVQWLQVDRFPSAVDHHTTFVRTTPAGTYLYVVGGVTADGGNIAAHPSIRRAPILDNHLLGAWEDETPLPSPLGFHGLAEGPHGVWLTAGISQDDQGPFAVNVTLFGQVDADGHLTFQAGPSLPQEARVHPTAHYVNGHVLVVGGSGPQQTPHATTQLADVGSDGTLSAWEPGPTLPAPRSHHAGAVYNDRIWLIGGFTTNQAPLSDVLVSEHAEDGTPTSWRTVTTLADPPWTAAATVYGDGLLLIGGGDGGPGAERYLAAVRYLPFDDSGDLATPMALRAPLPLARAHVHQVPVHDGYLYSVGGRRFSGASIHDVYVGYLAF